jgi:NADPH-dependent ferric siderophore reductase
VTLRREPPAFRRVEVRERVALTPYLTRVTLAGDELAGFTVTEPAASVRVLLPEPAGLVIPQWNGNEFLLPDGRRPRIRTVTPRYVRANELDVDVVVHDDSPLTEWATHGTVAAVSGPGRGYEIDPAATDFLLAGDETAGPAISQLLEHLPATVKVRVVIEARDNDCDDFVAAVAATEIGPDTVVWVAGEAAAVQRVRKDLFEGRGIPRSRATIRGYWKQGRAES